MYDGYLNKWFKTELVFNQHASLDFVKRECTAHVHIDKHCIMCGKIQSWEEEANERNNGNG